MSEPSITLSPAECEEIYRLIEELSGGNPENVFAWDQTDSLDDLRTLALVKIYSSAGAKVPTFPDRRLRIRCFAAKENVVIDYKEYMKLIEAGQMPIVHGPEK